VAKFVGAPKVPSPFPSSNIHARFFGYRQIEVVVACEVSHHNPVGCLPRSERVGGFGGETAGAVADQDVDVRGDGAVVVAGGIHIPHHRDVQFAVLVEVPHRQGVSTLRYRLAGRQAVIERGLEGAIAIAQKNTDGAATEPEIIRRDDVELAVVVEVTDGHRFGPPANGVVLGRRESAVAVPQEHADRPPSVGDDQVGDAGAGEVSHRHGRWTAAERIAHRGEEARHSAIFQRLDGQTV
jgi:hypothetical protein